MNTGPSVHGIRHRSCDFKNFQKSIKKAELFLVSGVNMQTIDDLLKLLLIKLNMYSVTFQA